MTDPKEPSLFEEDRPPAYLRRTSSGCEYILWGDAISFPGTDGYGLAGELINRHFGLVDERSEP